MVGTSESWESPYRPTICRVEDVGRVESVDPLHSVADRRLLDASHAILGIVHRVCASQGDASLYRAELGETHDRRMQKEFALKPIISIFSHTSVCCEQRRYLLEGFEKLTPQI